MTEKRLLPVSGKQMVKVFKRIGFQVDRQRGSHIIMSKGDAIIVIPIIKSTVPVGTLELISKILEKGGKRKGIDFDIASTPEFLRDGNAVYDFFHPTRMVIGYDNPILY